MCNKYFVEHSDKVEEFFSHDVLWSPKVLTEIHVDAATFRSHLISLLYLEGAIFQSKTPLTTDITREV